MNDDLYIRNCLKTIKQNINNYQTCTNEELATKYFKCIKFQTCIIISYYEKFFQHEYAKDTITNRNVSDELFNNIKLKNNILNHKIDILLEISNDIHQELLKQQKKLENEYINRNLEIPKIYSNNKNYTKLEIVLFINLGNIIISKILDDKYQHIFYKDLLILTKSLDYKNLDLTNFNVEYSNCITECFEIGDRLLEIKNINSNYFHEIKKLMLIFCNKLHNLYNHTNR